MLSNRKKILNCIVKSLISFYTQQTNQNVEKMQKSVPVFLAVVSGENSLTVTLGNIHCIQRLTFPLDPPMLLIFCSRVTVSANGPSSPAGTESPWDARTGAHALLRIGKLAIISTEKSKYGIYF